MTPSSGDIEPSSDGFADREDASGPASESRQVAITHFTAERFAHAPQTGLTLVQEWHSLLRWLTWPAFGENKQAAGAWCPCVLGGGRVKGGKGPVSLLVADVDECAPGAIEYATAVLATYAGAVIPTFSATTEKPKHRIVLLPDRPILADEFPLVWAKMASTLEGRGITLDRGCKNINRLYFACVARSPAAWLGARILTGAPVPVDAMLSAARAERAAAPVRRVPSMPVAQADRYARGALQRARENVENASEGGRHDALLREAYSLARLRLDEATIADALLEPFVARAGAARRREGERAIRDAVSARGTT